MFTDVVPDHARCCRVAWIWLGGAIMYARYLPRVIGNVFLGINEMEVPTRLFSSPEEARSWLPKFPEAVAA